MDWGTRFMGDHFDFCAKSYYEDRDCKRDRDELTHTEVLKAHNSLSNVLKFTGERPEDFTTGYIPTLDFQVKKISSNQFSYTFFEKGMRSPWVIPNINAMDRIQNRQCLANDVMRRLTKIEEKIFMTDSKTVLNQMNMKLIYSKYSLEDRVIILDESLTNY